MEIIFFAVIAALVLGRLYQVLGQNQGAEPPANRSSSSFAPTEPSDLAVLGDETGSPAEESNVVALKPKLYEGPGADGIVAIAKAQKGFSPEGFIEGARHAYAMIVSAYGSGDEATLKTLVDQDVFEAYQASMEERRSANAPKIEVVRISNAAIVDAALNGKMASIDVAFSADLADGGDGLRGVDEIWTFEREIDSRNPNWLLSAVQTK
jgi:predicted lipid-binding transport protein (Tim44 family)